MLLPKFKLIEFRSHCCPIPLFELSTETICYLDCRGRLNWPYRDPWCRKWVGPYNGLWEMIIADSSSSYYVYQKKIYYLSFLRPGSSACSSTFSFSLCFSIETPSTLFSLWPRSLSCPPAPPRGPGPCLRQHCNLVNCPCPWRCSGGIHIGLTNRVIILEALAATVAQELA